MLKVRSCCYQGPCKPLRQGRCAARGWSKGDLARMAGVMASRRLPPGAEVVVQGASSDALYFLRSGAARAVSLCCF